MRRPFAHPTVAWHAALFGFGVLTASDAWAAEEPKVPVLKTIVVETHLADPIDLPSERAVSTVSAADLALRLPQSAPEALHFEPGAFVQQTAHGQGSAFIRGLTGQQIVLLFDGIRLNNSTFRQGPNQYFFTLDAQTIESIELLRGSASTRYGSDAIGGVVMARPRQPLSQHADAAAWQVLPRLNLRGATADKERGGRAEFDLGVGPTLAFLGGVGGRRLGLLKGGGVVESPVDGSPALVPRLAADGRTQLGTGFDELTFDGRLVWHASPGQTVTLAAYGYRQYDAPRTDQCAPPYARFDECLIYREQFRTLPRPTTPGVTAPGFPINTPSVVLAHTRCSRSSMTPSPREPRAKGLKGKQLASRPPCCGSCISRRSRS